MGKVKIDLKGISFRESKFNFIIQSECEIIICTYNPTDNHHQPYRTCLHKMRILNYNYSNHTIFRSCLKCIPVSLWRGSVSHSIFSHLPIQPNNWQAMCWVPLSKPCPPTAAPSSLHQQCSIFLNAVLPAPNDSTLLYQTTTWRTTKNGNRNVFNSCTLPGRQWKDSWPPLYCSFTWAELSMGIGETAMESY